ncbi:retropepsin-like aspartic protease [Sphingomonas sp. BGYR3]|uniref:retropepsin-like aspartic protease family protein n=1 Tax=Sphingomonas sp. BGYR3 TaxID=2975483 RepID=UPI0021A49D55|nr:retropepsin-like aspartic protease [Sphingomonas sp. BGYR3]MDG5489240.1 retropepsin-like aspartic protease [Sphingomonas sp. BGYR3]
MQERIPWSSVASALLLSGAMTAFAHWSPTDRHAAMSGLAAVLAGPPPADAPGDPTPDASPAMVSIARSSDGMFYVTAMVNGQPHRFLVDTGASVMVLSRADAARLDIADIVDGGDTFRTVGGTRKVRMGHAQAVQIGNRTMRDVKVAIVDDDGVGVSLLGQSALAQAESITISKDRMTIR